MAPPEKQDGGQGRKPATPTSR